MKKSNKQRKADKFKKKQQAKLGERYPNGKNPVLADNAMTEMLSSYLASVVSKQASDVQINETTLAFKAGALMMHQIMMTGMDCVNESIAMSNLTKLDKEMRVWGSEFDNAVLFAGASETKQ